MDLRNINRLSIDGNRVASISSDRYQGYIWNETYDVRFVDSEAYGSKQISAVELVYGIDDSFPDVKYQSPYSNYAFDGWEPAIHPGELVSDDITCSAHYEYDGKTVILLFDENNGGQTNRRYADASKNVLIADKVRPDTLRPGTVEWKTPDMLSV